METSDASFVLSFIIMTNVIALFQNVPKLTTNVQKTIFIDKRQEIIILKTENCFFIQRKF